MPTWPAHESWTGQAACRDYPFPNHFYNMSADPVFIEIQLRSLCTEHCPVFDQCRAYIDQAERPLPASHHYGFWAGETVKQRQARRRADQSRRANTTRGRLAS
jgi:hypothetical protein